MVRHKMELNRMLKLKSYMVNIIKQDYHIKDIDRKGKNYSLISFWKQKKLKNFVILRYQNVELESIKVS